MLENIKNIFNKAMPAPEPIKPAPVEPVDLNPPPPKYPAKVIDKAQRIYNSQYNMGGGEGKTPPPAQVPPTAIPAGGRWGSGK